MTAARTLPLFAVLLAMSAAAGADTYLASMDPAMTWLDVRVCFASAPPDRLVAGSTSSRRALVSARRDESVPGTALRIDAGGIVTAGLADGDCLVYRIDTARASPESAGRVTGRRGSDLLLDAGAILYRRTGRKHVGIEFGFDLADGFAVSAPWPLQNPGSNSTLFDVGPTPPWWPGLVAIGRFEPVTVAVPGATLRIAILGSDPAAKLDDMIDWLAEAAASVSTLYGAFPLADAQILVVPLGARDEPVPWAQVLRGGGAAAHFFVDQTRPLEEFRADWTASHELSHMLLPYLGSDNAWLSEGFASYYQNVLRARSGLISERDAWQKLHDGFQRGIAATFGRPLDEATRNMRRDRAFMRVYWSGAAVVLKADVALRIQSDGHESLDTALAGLRDCCLPATRRWDARELARQLDALTGTTIVSSLHAAHGKSRLFPPLKDEYAQLGIEVIDGVVRLDDDAPLAGYRRAIMHGKNPATSATPGS